MADEQDDRKEDPYGTPPRFDPSKEMNELEELGLAFARQMQNSIGGGAYPTSPPSTLGRLSQRKELSIEVHRLRHELKVKEELLKLLDDNPIIERFMDLSRGVL